MRWIWPIRNLERHSVTVRVRVRAQGCDAKGHEVFRVKRPAFRCSGVAPGFEVRALGSSHWSTAKHIHEGGLPPLERASCTDRVEPACLTLMGARERRKMNDWGFSETARDVLCQALW